LTKTLKYHSESEERFQRRVCGGSHHQKLVKYDLLGEGRELGGCHALTAELNPAGGESRVIGLGEKKKLSALFWEEVGKEKEMDV